MAEADLDVVIRNLARQQYKALMASAKQRHAEQAARAAKAKDKDSRAHLKAMAKDALLLATATANRLQNSAANAADSYARAVKKAMQEARPKQAAAGNGTAGKVKTGKTKADKAKTGKPKAGSRKARTEDSES